MHRPTVDITMIAYLLPYSGLFFVLRCRTSSGYMLYSCAAVAIKLVTHYQEM